jgi:hypothetical protein
VCWDIGDEYRVMIRCMEDKIEELYDEWKGKCKK